MRSAGEIIVLSGDTGLSGEGRSMAEVHVKTLRRAAEIVGGEQELALQLKVTPSHLSLWIAGYVDPPGDIFLRAVDIVLERQLPQVGATPAERRTESAENDSYPGVKTQSTR